jgi:ketosteroid isomerase-like protein
MTTTDSTPDSIRPDDLPAVIRAFLAAHAAKEVDAAARTFTPDAVVVDQGETFRGSAQVLDFLQHAGSEFTYTSELTTARRVDDEHWLVGIRLEGNFPGGVADVDYRFTVTDDRISELTIG